MVTTLTPLAGCRSVSVEAPSATEAEALSTAASIMSEQNLAKLIAARPGLEVVLSDRSGELQMLRSERRSLLVFDGPTIFRIIHVLAAVHWIGGLARLASRTAFF